MIFRVTLCQLSKMLLSRREILKNLTKPSKNWLKLLSLLLVYKNTSIKEKTDLIDLDTQLDLKTKCLSHSKNNKFLQVQFKLLHLKTALSHNHSTLMLSIREWVIRTKPLQEIFLFQHTINKISHIINHQSIKILPAEETSSN